MFIDYSTFQEKRVSLILIIVIRGFWSSALKSQLRICIKLCNSYMVDDAKKVPKILMKSEVKMASHLNEK